MQDRYAGDVGDFGKIGMLRQIAQTGLTIGVNWYLVSDEMHNDDGKHTGYLNDPRFDGCDDPLRDTLSSVVHDKRSVKALKVKKLIPRVCCYRKSLKFPHRQFSREKWHRKALRKMKDCDIVFLDPDNGVLVKSVPINSPKSIKYVTRNEIADYFAAGKSVIFYNHRSRQKESEYLKRFSWITSDPRLKTGSIAGLKFVRGTIRDYFFILQPNHKEQILNSIDNMLNGCWGQHFSRLTLHSQDVAL